MAARPRSRSKAEAPRPARRRRAGGTLPPKTIDDLPRDLLDRPGFEGARWLALLRLAELRSSHRKLVGGRSDEGVHRFRVALRRLRGTLRELRPLLDESVGGKTRRRLRDLAAAAGARRDVDVHLAWLADERAALADSERPAIDWLEHALRRERHDADGALRHALDRDYDRVVRRLDRRLRTYSLTMRLGEDRPIAATRAELGATIDRLAHELASESARMQSIDDDRTIHRTRIAAKRLRYVLEPLAARGRRPAAVVRAASAVVDELKRLQDDLGLIHDAHVVGAWLADRVAESAARAARLAAPASAVHAPAASPEPDDSAVRSVARTLQERLRDRAAARWRELAAESRRHDLAAAIERAHDVAARLVKT